VKGTSNDEPLPNHLQVLIVTGGSRGIEAAISPANDTRKTEKLFARSKAGGGRAVAVQADISSESEVLRLFESVNRQLGGPTALANNAATSGR